MEVFIYEGSPITFDFGNGNKMVNATQMAKAFGKQVSDFLRLTQTKNYIAEISKRYGIPPNEIVKVVKGGNPKMQGTWVMHKLALKESAWLSAEFELWVYEKIEELLTKGTTSLQPQSRMDLIKLAYEAEKERIALAEQVEVLKPKAEYTDKVLNAVNSWSTSVIAKDLGMSAFALNKLLNEKRIQYKRNGVWLLYAAFQDKGYTDTDTYLYQDSKGNVQTNIQTKWTERGRNFIYHLLGKQAPIVQQLQIAV